MIVKVKTYQKDEYYVKVHQKLARDKDLSFVARGVMLFILSNSDAFNISVQHLLKQSPQGRTALRRCLRELKAAGYLTLKKTFDPVKKKIKGSNYWAFELPELNPDFKSEKHQSKQVEEPTVT